MSDKIQTTTTGRLTPCLQKTIDTIFLYVKMNAAQLLKQSYAAKFVIIFVTDIMKTCIFFTPWDISLPPLLPQYSPQEPYAGSRLR